MNPSTLSAIRRSLRVPLCAAAVAAIWAGAPQGAEAAGTAGNTVLRNTITVNYSDAKGNTQAPVSATVDISVVTVAATPTVLAFTPSPGSTDGTGATQNYTVRVRTNSNGPGAISFATADGSFVNVAAGTAPTVPGNIYLGSTIIDPSETKKGTAQTVANLASITFAVPNDNAAVNASGGAGAFNDQIINGIASGAIVYVTDGTSYFGPFTVSAVSDPAVGTGAIATPGSITLTNNTGAAIGPFTPLAGWQIVEAEDVSVTVTQGAVPILTAQNAANWVTTVSATMSSAAAGTGTVVTNAHMGKIAIAKYVRNATSPVTGSGPYTPPKIKGVDYTFYTNGVTAKPGDELEYLAVVTDIGTGSSTGVNASDLVPAYSTLVTAPTYGTAGSGTVFAHALFNGSETDLSTDGSTGAASLAYGKSNGTAAGNQMTFYVGAGCSSSAGGTLTSGQVSYVVYRVKIN